MKDIDNSYGFGIETTPLHLISAYNAILNGGIYKYPYFQKQNNFEEKRVISNDNSKLIKSILRKNVKEGTSRFADIPNINTYFKTGTANKKNDKGKYEDKKVRTTVNPNNLTRFELAQCIEKQRLLRKRVRKNFPKRNFQKMDIRTR